MYKAIIKSFKNSILGGPIPFLNNTKLNKRLEEINQIISKNDQQHHKIHFQSSAAFLFRGYVHQMLNDYKSALLDFKNAITQDPANNDAIYAANNHYKKHLSQNLEVKYLEKLFYSYKANRNVTDQNLSNSALYSAINHFMDKNYKESLMGLQSLFRMDSTNGEIYLLTGIIYLIEHKYDLALKYLNHTVMLLQKKHHHYHIYSSLKYYRRALLYYKINNLDLACNDLTKSLDLYNKNVDILFLRAQIYLKKGNVLYARLDLEKGASLGDKRAQKLLIKTVNSLTGI